MEVFTNQTKVIFTNAEAASKAKEIASQVIASVESNYHYRKGIKNTIKNLSIEENALILPEDVGELASNDLLEIMTDVVKAIAAQLPSENFTFEVVGCDTYSEGSLEGKYGNGSLEIKSTYYPLGNIYLCCPECGAEVVEISDYDPNQKYTCPVCGEEIDLSEVYDKSAPIIETKIITIS